MHSHNLRKTCVLQWLRKTYRALCHRNINSNIETISISGAIIKPPYEYVCSSKETFNLSIYICIIREIPINNVTQIFELWNKLQITARYCERWEGLTYKFTSITRIEDHANCLLCIKRQTNITSSFLNYY